MGFITMLSREAGKITYGTRMIEQDRINLSVQVDLGNCSQEAYIPTTDVTALTDGVIWFEDNFYIPDAVTEFSFVDDGIIHVWTWNVDTWDETTFTEVAYTPTEGAITAISDGVTHDGTHFLIPTGVTSFTFIEGTTDMEATFSVDTWIFAEAITTYETVAYDPEGLTVDNISDGGTFDSETNEFSIPTGITAFTFDLDGVEIEAEYDTVEATDWAFLLHIASTTGAGAGENQSWVMRLTGGTMKVHWGNGQESTLSGTSPTTLTNNYVEEAPEGEPYKIRFSGDFLNISRVECNSNNLTGDIDKFSILREMALEFWVDNNDFDGSINRLEDMGNPSQYKGGGNTELEGDIDKLSAGTWTWMHFGMSSDSPGKLSGDLSSLSRGGASGTRYLVLDWNNINGMSFVSTDLWGQSGGVIQFRGCGLTTNDVDNAIIAFGSDDVTYVRNTSIDLRNNAGRTVASLEAWNKLRDSGYDAWAEGTYNAGDKVENNGSIYRADQTTDREPGVTADWEEHWTDITRNNTVNSITLV